MIQRPNHHIDTSFYFCDTARYGNFNADLDGPPKAHNAHYAWCYRAAKTSTTPAAVWIKELVQSCQRAWDAKRSILIDLNLQEKSPAAATPLVAVLQALSPFWPRVPCLALADEPRWTKVAGLVGTYQLSGSGSLAPLLTKHLPDALARRASTAATAAKVRATVKALGLPSRPLSAVYSTAQFPGAPIDSLDIVGIEAYVDLPASTASSVNTAKLKQYLVRAKKAVPIGKSIHLVPMSYSRNFAFLDIGTLKKSSPEYRNAVQCLLDIQDVAFDSAKNDPRVVGVNCFSWARASGCLDYPKLALKVKQRGKELLR